MLLILLLQLPASGAVPSPEQVRRLGYQHRMDYAVPLWQATFIGTHNSYSTTEHYSTFVNHARTMTEQLDYGVRVLNYDLDSKGGAVALCHGTCFGRSSPLLLQPALASLDDWLSQNPDEVVLLVHEINFDFDNRYGQAAEEIEAEIRSRTYTPRDHMTTDGTCRELPLTELTKQDVRDAGRNVIMVTVGCKGNDSLWNDLVWSVSAEAVQDIWDVKDYLRSEDKWTFVPEDRCEECTTTHPITGDQYEVFLELGAAVLGLDYFVTQGRHLDLIWSWDVDEPRRGTQRNCALVAEHWSAQDCGEHHPFACQNMDYPGYFEITGNGPWQEGEAACQALGNGQFVFSAPVNASSNEVLRRQAGGYATWVKASDQAQEGTWNVDGVDAFEVPPPIADEFTFSGGTGFGKLGVKLQTWGGTWTPWGLSGGGCFDYNGGGVFGWEACDDTDHHFKLHADGRLQFKRPEWGGNRNPWGLDGGACFTYQGGGQFGSVACAADAGNWRYDEQTRQLHWYSNPWDLGDGACFKYQGGGAWGFGDCVPMTAPAARRAGPRAGEAVDDGALVLDQNTPNPFNPSTTITYAIGARSHVRLTIHNLLGQHVQRLVDEVQSPGRYAVTWDGRDTGGQAVSTGVYFYRVEAGGRSAVRRMTFVR